ncbi:CHCHD4 [Cordylochernes scorpioides]|uniref:CHCHD4 n=1 Tax=Cordylochernes scorpioides TaxID=51811 RepID=A0ABY6KLD8_9ARAC|nr:CHCHD4 [Cordylochernes scorpioides]
MLLYVVGMHVAVERPILPNGDINWECPCLGNTPSGPCGVQFREAFSCFTNSMDEPKGSECREAFDAMTTCMVQYPKLFAHSLRRSGIPSTDDNSSS